MNDLMITINVPASVKSHFIVLDTYITNIKVNKNGRHLGGSISPVDLSQWNFTDIDSSHIYELFCKYCIKLSRNSYFVEPKNFVTLFNEANLTQNFYIDNKDRTIYVINKVNLNSSTEKAKFNYKIDSIQIKYAADNSLSIIDTETSPYHIQTIIPTAVLHFSAKNNIYSLYFDYNGTVSTFAQKDITVCNENIIYLKNYNYEISICDLLVKNNFIKLSQNRFVYSGHLGSCTLKNLLKNSGIMVQSDDSVILPKIKVFRHDSEWFEISLNCVIDDELIDLVSEINLYSTNTEIAHGDKNILIPESILQSKDYLKIHNNSFRINRQNLFYLLRIIHDSDSDIDTFFSYKDIELKLPNRLKSIAFDYQIKGIQWLKFLYLNKLGGCLADDMGLGKTFQIISFLSEDDVRKGINLILIVVPKSLLTNWCKEFNKFNPVFRVGVYHGESRKELKFSDYDVIITTYQTARSDVDILNEYNFDAIIFDEIQIIKNQNSCTSEILKSLKSKMRIGLSGTPMENDLNELWNIMDILNPRLFPSCKSFLARYRNQHLDELKTLLSPFILRRLKSDVLKDLPPKNEQVIYCDMDSEQRKLYNSITLAVRTEIMKLKAFSAPIVLKGLLLLRECCCHPKLLNCKVNVRHIEESCKMETLQMIVNNSLQAGHKILIFSQFTKMLNLIREELKTYEDIIYYLDGKTDNRAQLVTDFEQSESAIFLISIKAGGVGLNLISAQDVVIFDPWWNPFVEQQAIDRVYRIGQNKPINIYKLVAANSIEENILKMQLDKAQNFDDIINGISGDKNFSLEKILNLI